MTVTEDSTQHQGDGPSSLDGAEVLAKNLVRLFQESGKVLSELADKGDGQIGPYSMASEVGEAAKVLGSVARQWVQDPAKLAEAQGQLMTDYAELWGRSVRRFFGEDVDPVISPEPGDNRFADEDWSQSQYFDFWKQAYLLTSNWVEDLVENTEGLDERTQQKAEFYANLIASALSPSNFAFTNPEVVREIMESKGQNLANGMAHLAEDLKHSDDLLQIKQTDLEAFEVGKNLAVTPGKVVFQNDILQLIQYTPQTEKVYGTPLLIVPPWINKYYILDLVPKKSFINWAVAQGFTVFTISWVNPDEALAGKTFDDYMHEGVLAATQAVIDATGVKQINTLGYCVGGTLLATTLAYMAATDDDRIKSATFLTTQTDFTKAGDLLVFIDDAQLASLEEMMAEVGYLDGARMATVFNMLRPKDLIWPYVVNNYLLGKKPFPFDLLYWNSDSTRLPAANHSFYLREFYGDNKLATGDLELSGETLDLSKVKTPIYELAAKEDHIAPAASVYLGSKLFGGPVRFVLAGSGHIAGVINPPAKNKYQFWTGRKPAGAYETWLKNAKETPGSWWPDWQAWIAKQAKDQVPARKPGSRKYKPIEDAPGSYVKVQS